MAITILALAAAAAVVIGCAYQPTPEAHDPPGFFIGLWHGVVSPYALIAGIVTEVRVYAFPNSGWWYDLGFMIGLLPWAFSAMSIGARIAAV